MRNIYLILLSISSFSAETINEHFIQALQEKKFDEAYELAQKDKFELTPEEKRTCLQYFGEKDLITIQDFVRPAISCALIWAMLKCVAYEPKDIQQAQRDKDSAMRSLHTLMLFYILFQGSKVYQYYAQSEEQEKLAFLEEFLKL